MINERLHLAFQRIEKAQTPLFFCDDDPDGLCSGLLLQKFFKKGSVHLVKATHYEHLASYVETKIVEHQADLCVFLDKASLPDDVWTVAKDAVWIDHHKPQQPPQHCLYVNPLLDDPTDNRPTTYLAYKLIGMPNELLWLATCGIVSDWHTTDVLSLFEKQHPDAVNEKKTAPELLFETKLGTAIQIISFNLHGKSKDISKAVRSLKQIQTFEELLIPATKHSKFLLDRHAAFLAEYNLLLDDVKAQSHVSEHHIIYTYTDAHTSFTSYLSNQLLFEHPGKLIIIARLKENTYRCSLRITPPHDIARALSVVFSTYPGEGGGHPQACGARIPEAVFGECITALEKELFKNKKSKSYALKSSYSSNI